LRFDAAPIRGAVFECRHGSRSRLVRRIRLLPVVAFDEVAEQAQHSHGYEAHHCAGDKKHHHGEFVGQLNRLIIV